MAGFPRLPLVNGDTDDDASIHLHTHVGPARPLRQSNSRIDKDQEILRVLNEETEDSGEWTKMNKYFSLYKDGKLDTIAQLSSESDSDSDTYNETEDEEEKARDYEFNKEDSIFTIGSQNRNEREISDRLSRLYTEPDPTYPSPLFDEIHTMKENLEGEQEGEQGDRQDDRQEPGSSTLWKYTIVFGISFLLTAVAFLAGQFIHFQNETPRDGVSYGLSNKLKAVESNIKNLIEVTNTISSRQNFVESNYDNLVKSMNDKFDLASEKFRSLEKGIALGSKHYHELHKQFTQLKADSGVYANPEAKLDEINQRLGELSSVTSDLKSTKSKLMEEFLAVLPQHVPVYIKNKRVHFTPELHKYLYAFIENYHHPQGNGTSWSQFVQENGEKLDAYINPRTGIKRLAKDQFEELLDKRLEANNRRVFEKVNGIIDSLQYSTNTSIVGDKMFLSGMLEVFSKGSIKVNYADYNLGSRILGFLTHLGVVPEKPLARRLFLGWFDYISGTSVQLPSQWKYNANNVILDNGSSWTCADGKCSVGIRLFNSVVPTDIVVKMSPENSARWVTIYVKPRNSGDTTRLRQHMEKIHLGTDETPKDKYLAKFVKVKELRVPKGYLKHIKMPLSVINLRVPVKDVYVEFRAETPLEVNNVKVYGITELDAYKYEEDYTTILDKIMTEDTEHEVQDEIYEDAYDQIYDEDFQDIVLE